MGAYVLQSHALQASLPVPHQKDLPLLMIRLSALSVTASFHTKTDCSGHPFKSFAGSPLPGIAGTSTSTSGPCVWRTF
ncbi:hypothetical protein D3C76_1631470 [compost metagenome]